MARKIEALFTPIAAVDLVLNYDGALHFKKAFINDIEMTFYGGKARFRVSPGGQYRLRWEVMGFVGTKWSYAVVSETTGFTVDPATLTKPGRSYTLRESYEQPRAVVFTVTIVPEEG